MNGKTVFVSYSQKDNDWRNRLVAMLDVLVRQGKVVIWDDTKIGAGLDWYAEIQKALSAARVAILLISERYLSSDFILREEVPRFLEKQAREGLLVVPVLVAPCLWEAVDWLRPRQLRPASGRALSEYLRKPRIDAELKKIAKEVYFFLGEGQPPSGEGPDPRAADEASPVGPEPTGARDLLPPPVDALSPGTASYVIRPADLELRNAIDRRDGTIVVRGVRRSGKTSLLSRGLEHARRRGAEVVYVGLQEKPRTAESLYRMLIDRFVDELGLDLKAEDVWDSHRDPTTNFGSFLRRELPERLRSQLIWALDNAEWVIESDLFTEVFGLFRSWQSLRAANPSRSLRDLTLIVSYDARALLRVDFSRQAQLNIGTPIALGDFSPDQVAELNRRYNSPLHDDGQLAGFRELVGGHPYLVNRGLYEMSRNGVSLDTFRAKAADADWVFGEHLRFLLQLIQDHELSEALQSVLDGGPCSSRVFFGLRDTGAMVGESPKDIRPRCGLYAAYLAKHLP